MPEPLVVQVIRDSQEKVRAAEAAEMRAMTSAWLKVERSLESQMVALAYEIDGRRQDGKSLTKTSVMEMDRYKALMAQAKERIAGFNGNAVGTIEKGQGIAIENGLDVAEDAIRASYRDAGVVVASFDKLPIRAVEAMIGFTVAGTPLETLLRDSYGDAVSGLTDSLIRAIAVGMNPKDTAAEMAKGMGIGLDRALLVARTEQLRAYRESSRMAYQESGVVKGYKRLSAKQDRTCAACLFADGQFYELETAFEEHPNGRCTLVPVVNGLPPVVWQTGMDWFNSQGTSVQQGILGAGGYDLWQSGAVDLSDFVQRDEDDVWGASLRVASLESLIQ